MRLSSVYAALVAIFAASALPTEAAPMRGECDERLNFEDMDIGLVIDEMARRTGKKFVVDPRVAGFVTIKSGADYGLCREEAWDLFQAALRVNGFTATLIANGSYKIVPVQVGAREAGVIETVASSGYVTEIVRLGHIDAREAAASVTPIVGETGVVASVPSANALIVVDAPANVERVKDVLERIDRDATVVETFDLKNVSAADVALTLAGFAQGVSEEGADAAGLGKIQATPVASSNRLLVRGSRQAIAQLRQIVTEIDRYAVEEADLAVLPLRHADAEQVAALLQNLAENLAPASVDGEGVGRASKVTISPYPPTNSVIILGDVELQKRLKAIVTQLDVRRRQVLVEAIIVEVSDETARELGLNYFVADRNGDRVLFSSNTFRDAERSALSRAGAALLSDDPAEQRDLAADALDSLLSISGTTIGGAGTFGSGQIFGAILSAVKEDDRSRVLSFPSVVTLDNEAATLSVGQEIPITTGEAIGDDFTNAFRTVSREEVGIILKVTPQINSGGTITLEISQESSSVAGQIIESSTDLITNKRAITTTAVVDDGDILVIGGLVDQMEEDFQTKTPFLGDVPVFGNLFKSTSRTRSNRNLMVFLRPTILETRDAARRATSAKLDYIETTRKKGRRSDPTVRDQIEAITGAPVAFSEPAATELPAQSVEAPPPKLPPAEPVATLAAPEPAKVAAGPVRLLPEIDGGGAERPTLAAYSDSPQEDDTIALSSVLFGVHLASYRTSETAIAGWRDLQDQFAVELASLSPRIARYSDPERGNFLRLVAGPLSSQDAAYTLCEALRASGAYCQVTAFQGGALPVGPEG